MTNAELIQSIRAEIDKRYSEYRAKMKTDDFTYYEGMADALDLFEQFLDTLESEKPTQEWLEEEIKRWLKEGEITDTRYDDYDDNDIEATARHFAKWGAEHAKKNK